MQTTISNSPAWLPHRDALINELIQALETNASWVELFGVTGELNVPGTDEDEKLFEPLHRIKEV